MNRFLTRCIGCGSNTSIAHAKAHEGLCKPCVGGPPEPRPGSAERRNQIILESGYDAYAREEGHYDEPDF